MVLRMPRRRSGITLTEVLISILLLGVGVTSLMTLFPLGLLRVREAARLSRSAYLVESATAELEARDLLNKMSFLNSNYSPWYSIAPYTPQAYDPWVQDTASYRANPYTAPVGAYRGKQSTGSGLPNILGPGLPVAYDPLWRQQTGIYPGVPNAPEARFASGIGSMQLDPDGTAPSAHGLQRITNFNPTNPPGYGPFLDAGRPSSNAVPEIFVSPEDIVLQSDTDVSQGAGKLSPIVPDMTLNPAPLTPMGAPEYDWKYTWMFTGQQADCTNGTVFSGDIVVFENRPFAVSSGVVAGEPVVEAIFGYTGTVRTATSGGSMGYGLSANRTVLLRWPASMPDPEVHVGSWIADVTYERSATVDLKRRYTDPSGGGAGVYYPYQRCYWYQVAKRTTAEPGTEYEHDNGVSYREMTVWVSTPLRAFTLLNVAADSKDVKGSPVHLNAALVSPYVVNVFPRTIYTR